MLRIAVFSYPSGGLAKYDERCDNYWNDEECHDSVSRDDFDKQCQLDGDGEQNEITFSSNLTSHHTLNVAIQRF